MSYATGTTHYNLPQTVGSDKRDWTDTNQAFSDLDTAVYGAAQGAEAATSAIQTINSELDVIAGKQATDEENITTLNGKVSTLEGTTSTLGAEVLDVRQDLQDNIESKHEASATSTHAYAIGDTFYYNDILYKATAAIAIGDTIVPTVNCMGITVMSQVSAIKGDLTASDGLGFEFMTDGDGNYGYRGADDSFVPFSHGGGSDELAEIISAALPNIGFTGQNGALTNCLSLNVTAGRSFNFNKIIEDGTYLACFWSDNGVIKKANIDVLALYAATNEGSSDQKVSGIMLFKPTDPTIAVTIESNTSYGDVKVFDSTGSIVTP